MIFCLGTTPAIQRVMVFQRVTLDVVNRAVETLEGTAGKSVNVAKVLRAFGEEVFAASFFGGDRGEVIRAVLEGRGVRLGAIPVGPRTRLCTTLVDRSAGTHTELVEESQPVGAAAYERLGAIIEAEVPRARAVVMSGSITPGGPADLYRTTTELAGRHGVLSVVDAQGAPLTHALPASPGLVKPNRAELAATTGRPLGDEAAVVAAMRELHERGAQRVLATAGGAPTMAFDGRRVWRVTPPRLQVVNPIGSGDAFTAGLVWSLLRGDDLGEACRWGTAAGAANALTWLPGEVERGEVERLAPEVRVEGVSN